MTLCFEAIPVALSIDIYSSVYQHRYGSSMSSDIPIDAYPVTILPNDVHRMRLADRMIMYSKVGNIRKTLAKKCHQGQTIR